ncbi:MAG: alpha-galactosidase, partial [Lachnospiraceae bacterium]|nr:alpha-galactosidase [Lachnospiraceae bacterium]
MSIRYNPDCRTITLNTARTTYQVKIDRLGVARHAYYGARTADEDLSYLVYEKGDGMSVNPYEAGYEDRSYSLDTLPQEYSGFGSGDYRETALSVRDARGAECAFLRFESFQIRRGKYGLGPLPSACADAEAGVWTLVLRLCDRESGVSADLYYGVFEEEDVITRAVRIRNGGTGPVTLEKCASLQLDFQYGAYELVTFPGKWAGERRVNREKLTRGVKSVGSRSGASGAFYNPSAILTAAGTGETRGEAYGIAFVYSGDFLLQAEVSEFDSTRLLLGIHPDHFRWTLAPGETFTAPEAVMAFSDAGLECLSHRFHRFVQDRIVRGYWRDRRRPVLLNSWEGTYFTFTGEKLLRMAREAQAFGAELFVLDDGWFGKREDDRSGLGDWFPNERKLRMSMAELGEGIRAMGLGFGLWFEPEAVSEDSDLFRAHPDWAVSVPGRKPSLGRYELVLDLSRKDVQDWLITRMGAVIREAGAAYVKWDFNRNLTDLYSAALPAERQGEFQHRFILGTYRVLGALLEAFPGLLVEGCSSGGARFDLGMLCFTPQIWTSDNTDAIDRLSIQYGTSVIYPPSVMGAHVSAVPNHQTGRVTPLETRAAVAMAGCFG